MWCRLLPLVLLALAASPSCGSTPGQAEQGPEVDAEPDAVDARSDGGFADDVSTVVAGSEDVAAGPVAPQAPPVPRFDPLLPPPAVRSCYMDPEAPPALLSDSGCYLGSEPAAELIPYALRSPLWTDGAIKTRFIALPPDSFIGLTEAGEWEWPDGALIFKSFTLEQVEGEPSSRRHVETRVMVRVPGDWRFYSYRWREDGSDADLLAEDLEVTFDLELADGERSLRYYFPDEDGCQHCHASVALGPRTEQLNMQVRYGDDARNQLDAMADIGLFGSPIQDVGGLARIPDPFDPTASLEQRARSYLHGNCAHCHRPGGWQPPELTLDLRFETPLDHTETCGVPYQYNLAPGTGDLRIDPGDPDNSMILGRMLVEDLRRMPSIGTFLVDPDGTALVRDWIASLAECP